ncbi:MAG: DUF1707 domain-containing protein [Actinomycetota bacterium]|nr:DUF1707 domain-containing protein [Actinomycetota bacterium]
MSTDPRTWRISDLDRENAARLLGTAMEQGRLTPVEYSDRCQDAYAARTRAELVAVLADLPGGPLGLTHAGLEPLVLNVAFGQVRRTGRWPVPELVQITGIGQRTVLDLTEAHLERPEVVIEVSATMSATVVLLPGHAQLDTDELELVVGTIRRRGWSGRGLPGWGLPAGAGESRGRGGLLRRRGRNEPPPIRVVLRGRARLSTVTIWQPRR